MTTEFVCGSSPIWQYPTDIPMHPSGVCDGSCVVCKVQQAARENGRATIVGSLVWSGTETHSELRQSFLDWLLGRLGKWVFNMPRRADQEGGER
jgi:hypothetical protein